MKSAKELFERLQSDEAFAKEFREALTAKREAGAKDVYDCFVPVAAEYGYEVSKEEIDAVLASNSEELSEEELGKLAGGTSCLTAAIVATVVSGLGSAAASISYLVDG